MLERHYGRTQRFRLWDSLIPFFAGRVKERTSIPSTNPNEGRGNAAGVMSMSCAVARSQWPCDGMMRLDSNHNDAVSKCVWEMNWEFQMTITSTCTVERLSTLTEYDPINEIT